MEYNSTRKNHNIYEKDIEQNTHQQNEDSLNTTFNNLYLALNPNCPSNYSLPSNFQNLLKRILSTNFSIMKNDESKIINSLLDQVSQKTNFNQEVINKFQYLYSKLTKKRNLTKRWGILYILNTFAKKNNTKETNFIGTNELQQNYLNMNINNTTNKKNKNNTLLDRDFLLLNQNNNPNENSNQKLTGINPNLNTLNPNNNIFNEFSPVSNVNERFYENQNSLNYNNINNISMNNYKEPNVVVNMNKTSLIITEKDLINDLLFVFEGINGKYIAYDAQEDAYVLNKLIPWNEDIYNIVSSLSEIGWLYKKIKMYLDFYKESNIQSQFIKSFVNALQNELNNYFKLISFFRKLNSEQNININMNNNDKRSQNLNLKNIVLWTLVPKETLKWLAACCESLHSLKGTSVLSQIYSFVHYGGCNNYLNNILNEVSKPFILFVINWIKYGELQDLNKEFFVDILTGIKDDDIWNLQYQLVGKNVPNFMQREPTIKIFEAGKCIHFIRNYCQENYNLSNLKNILINLIKKYSVIKDKKEKIKEKNNLTNINNINPDLQMDLDESSEINGIKDLDINNNNNNIKNKLENKYDFDYGFDEDKIYFEIESYKSCLDFIEYIFDPSKQEEILNISFINEIIFNIDVIHKLINKDLVRIIFTKYKFMTNLDSINKYLLLSQGDMMQSLMESLYEELDKPANLIFKHNLQSNLESAIRASNAQYNDPDCLKKLNIKLINASVGDVGWDIFCLEYKVDLPLNVIFNNNLLKDYQKLFFFFWKIKRIEYSQNNHIWKKVKTLNQLINTKLCFMKKAVQISIHFNQEIIHFMSNYHNYFALQALESQYKKLVNELPKVNNLNELIEKHKSFLENIKKQCLLDEENKIISKKITNIFDIILRFRTIHDVLYNFLVEHSYEAGNMNDSIMNQTRLKNIKEYLNQMVVLYKDFHNQIIELLNTIELIGKDNLSFLQIKIDFNNYYSFLEKEKEEKKNKEIVEKINKEEERKKLLNEQKQKYNNDIQEEEIDIDEDNNNINNINNINNNIDNENGSQIDKSSSKFEYTLKKNDNSNDESDNNNNNISNDNISAIHRSKINNIKITTKRKDQNKNIIAFNNNRDKDNILDLNKQMNGSNDISNGYLAKHDLKGEIINNYTDYLNQELDDTTTNNQYDKSQPSMIYNHKSITKNKPDTRLHLDKNEIEEEIVTEVKPKVYGIATKTFARKNKLDEDE